MPRRVPNAIDATRPRAGTGAPKGIVHATGGYMVGAGHSFRTVFDAPTRADDVWFCTAVDLRRPLPFRLLLGRAWPLNLPFHS